MSTASDLHRPHPARIRAPRWFWLLPLLAAAALAAMLLERVGPASGPAFGPAPGLDATAVPDWHGNVRRSLPRP